MHRCHHPACSAGRQYQRNKYCTNGVGQSHVPHAPSQRHASSAAVVAPNSAADSGQGVSISRSDVLRLAMGGTVALDFLADIVNPQSSEAFVKSLASDQSATLTFKNESKSKTLKVYWINYDGDPELYVYVLPTDSWTVDTYVSHPWRVVDNTTGVVLKEVTAVPGYQVVKISGRESALKPDSQPFSGFDGIGGQESDYRPARIETMVIVGVDAGFVVLSVPENRYPVNIPVVATQMMGILQASEELRRPTGLASWQNSLQAAGATVQRVLLTRVVPPLFYARIVMELPGGTLVSVDAQPGDSLALAQQTNCPVYISNQLASIMDQAMDTDRSVMGLGGEGGFLESGPGAQLPKGPRYPGQPAPTLILPPPTALFPPEAGAPVVPRRGMVDA